MGSKNLRRILGGATALGAALALAGGGLATASTDSETGTLDGSMSSSSNSEHTTYGMNGWMDTCPFEEILTFNEDGTAVPGPQSCFTFVVREGTMQLGDIAVEMEPNSMMIAGGMDAFERNWNPEEGSVYSNPVTVPGGALGTGSAENFWPTAITAHVEEAGTPYFNNDLADMYLNLPIKLKLSNPALGDNCYIGTDDDPIDLTLSVDPDTMGGHESPIPGDDGNTYTGHMYPHTEASDVDFSVPGATGCGPLGLGGLNGLVNFRAGLPSEGGNNNIWTQASFYSGAAWQIWNENL